MAFGGRKWVWSIGGALIIGYVGLSAYVVSRQDIESLLVCAEQGGLKIPYAKSICRAYLSAARGTPDDIEALQRGVGATFVVQGSASSEEKEQLLVLLISKGLDVNHIDMRGSTPLHAAVLAGAEDEVDLLLNHGARIDLKDAATGLTAPELALKLQVDHPARAAQWAGVVARLQRAASSSASARH